MDRPPGQGRRRRRRRLAVLRIQPVKSTRRKIGTAAATGVHRPCVGTCGVVDTHGRARDAGRYHRQSAVVHAGQSRDRIERADGATAVRDAADYWCWIRQRHRPQLAGRRRQGQQHAADRCNRCRVLGDRVRAAQARRAAASGGDGSHHRRGHADRQHQVRRRLAVQGRRTFRQGLGREHQQPAGRRAKSFRAPAGDAESGVGAGAGLHVHHQQRQFPRRYPGRVEAAGPATATPR